VIVRAQTGETVEALIWRALGQVDAALLAQVLDDDRNAAVPLSVQLPPGTALWLPEVAPDAAAEQLQRQTEIWD